MKRENFDYRLKEKNTQNELYTSLFSSTADMRFKYKPIVTSVSEVPVELRTQILHTLCKATERGRVMRGLSDEQSTAKQFRYEIEEKKRKNETKKWIRINRANK